MGAWNLGYTGQGVTVAVFDSGVQLNHPDLIDNINEELSFDALNQSGNGNPIFSQFNRIAAHGTAVAGLIGATANNGIGGVGVAPGVELAAVRLIDFGQTEQAFIDAFRYTIFNGIDITNNSWGPGLSRAVSGPTLAEFLALRDSILFGREGKGVIHVFSAGNNAGPGFAEGWQPIGEYDSSAYNGWLNNRYTIGVTGVDHDGFYNNVDGTITPYPEISPAILVAAPTGSNAGLVITNDTGLGSGLWTTDLTGDFGFNAVPDPNGQETNDAAYPFDRDFLPNADFTSRMNGTSASAPLASGVIALMLEANPELTWRDVQEILVRSARMNAPLGIPQEGQSQGIGGTQSTWIVNQIPIFHDVEFVGGLTDAFQQTMQPIQDPNFVGFGEYHVAAPHVMTNGAGYTVSQGRGAYGEMIGYAHGVLDAELAVRLAEQWHTKNQALPPELSFTSFSQGFGLNIPAAEQGNNRTGWQLVPGGLGGRPGFIGLYNELFAEMPNFDQDFIYRGFSSIEFNVPANQTMSVENVEVKVSVGGDAAEALDHLRILLISPDGTQSELNNYWMRPTPVSPDLQPLGESNGLPPQGDPGSINTQEGSLVWTFRSTRSWGERSDDRIVFDPVTGMPAVDQLGQYREPTIDPDTGLLTLTPGQAMTQGWRVVIENWGDTSLVLNGLEMAWHGRPISAESQRISGAIGIDEDGDDNFNFSRMVRLSDGSTFGSVINIPDVNQEDFAENITVVARRVSDNQIVGRFVTGHDGNFYFDLVPDEYVISIEDPEGRPAADDSITPDGVLDHYRAEWHIGPEHFKVWQKTGGLGEFETPVDANGVPIPWLDDNGEEQVYGIKGLNFLLDPGDAPPDQVSFSGTVYADTNGDGVLNGSDTALPNVTVYVDANQNGAFDAGETSVQTSAEEET
ncbi:MAG TPA: S8 family serine peptidase, partial [Lacipirellula sp.]